MMINCLAFIVSRYRRRCIQMQRYLQIESHTIWKSDQFLWNSVFAVATPVTPPRSIIERLQLDIVNPLLLLNVVVTISCPKYFHFSLKYFRLQSIPRLLESIKVNHSTHTRYIIENNTCFDDYTMYSICITHKSIFLWVYKPGILLVALWIKYLCKFSHSALCQRTATVHKVSKKINKKFSSWTCWVCTQKKVKLCSPVKVMNAI